MTSSAASVKPSHNATEAKPTMRKVKRVVRRWLVRAAQQCIILLYPWPRGKRLKNGLKLKIDPRNSWIDFNLAIRSGYEEGTLQLIDKLLPEGGVFIDIGANIGVMSTFAARKTGPNGMVLSFEPDEKNFSRLTWAREANAIPQMLPIPIALGDKPIASRAIWRWGIEFNLKN